MQINNNLDRILKRVDNLDYNNLIVLVKRLIQERKSFRTVFNTIYEGILIIDYIGNINYYNESSSKIIGINKNIPILNIWKMVPKLLKSINFIDKLYKIKFSFFREIYLDYPEKRYVKFFFIPLYENHNQITNLFIVIIHDITENKLSEKEKIKKAKDSYILLMASIMAHEVGNPLNSINIHLELINRYIGNISDVNNKKLISKSLNSCINEVKRLNDIINNIFNLIDNNKHNNIFTNINLCSILTEVLDLKKRELSKINIITNFDKNIPTILGNSTQIKQIFLNIINNSKEAMSKDGTLKIKIYKKSQFVIVTFSDNGIGINKSSFAKLFNNHFSTKEKGTGIGMMIISNLMKQHGGSLEVESKNNTGTTLRLQFPYQKIKVGSNSNKMLSINNK